MKAGMPMPSPIFSPVERPFFAAPGPATWLVTTAVLIVVLRAVVTDVSTCVER